MIVQVPAHNLASDVRAFNNNSHQPSTSTTSSSSSSSNPIATYGGGRSRHLSSSDSSGGGPHHHQPPVIGPVVDRHRHCSSSSSSSPYAALGGRSRAPHTTTSLGRYSSSPQSEDAAEGSGVENSGRRRTRNNFIIANVNIKQLTVITSF